MKLKSALPLAGFAGFLAALSSCKDKQEESVPPPPEQSPEPGGDISTLGAAPDSANAWITQFRAIEDDGQRLEFLADTLATGADDIEKIMAAALDDPSAEIRREAMQGTSSLDPDKLIPILAKAADDADEFVRDYAMTDMRRLPKEHHLKAYANTITSPHRDVRDKSIGFLANLQNHEGFELMLEAIRDGDEAAMEHVNRQAQALVGQSFQSHEQAVSWWRDNKDKFDEYLQPLGE